MSSAMLKPTYEQNLKLLLLGDSGVGKTSLMMRFTDQTFSSTFVSTVGIDFKYKNIQLSDPVLTGGKPVNLRLELWDTAGQERFKSITASYLRGAQGILICYDIADRKSFQQVDVWIQDIHQFADVAANLVLVGTKSDLTSTRQVSEQEGRALADAHGILFFECSAKNQISVEQPFMGLAKQVFARMKKSGLLKEKRILLTSAEEANKDQAASGGCGC
ncbi:hypothetical protein BASA81_003183 [Batrachochytrium salamandrivorans]|nr:hypothetical protein BASA81_003183 [Batrachochytrium salamandrivorans]